MSRAASNEPDFNEMKCTTSGELATTREFMLEGARVKGLEDHPPSMPPLFLA